MDYKSKTKFPGLPLNHPPPFLNEFIDKSLNSNGRIEYSLDPDGEGPSEVEIINNPDFNYISLRGNAVLRWEYMPGSALYLVWTQSREEVEPVGDFYFMRSFDNLFNLRPDNIFMLKLSYWFGM